MVKKEKVVVKLRNGLQARPAAQFVQEANKYSSRVQIEKDGKVVNAKSIMGMMSVAVGSGQEMTLLVDGPDEVEAIAALRGFVESVD